MKNTILVVVGALLLVACNSQPEFTRIIKGKVRTGTYFDTLMYREVVLVSNSPTGEDGRLISYFKKLQAAKLE